MTDPLLRRYQRLTITLRANDHVHHHSLATELLRRAKTAHLSGATLLHATSNERTGGTRRLLPADVPLSLLIVEGEEALAAFLEDSREVLGAATVVLDNVAAFRL